MSVSSKARRARRVAARAAISTALCAVLLATTVVDTDVDFADSVASAKPLGARAFAAAVTFVWFGRAVLPWLLLVALLRSTSSAFAQAAERSACAALAAACVSARC